MTVVELYRLIEIAALVVFGGILFVCVAALVILFVPKLRIPKRWLER